MIPDRPSTCLIPQSQLVEAQNIQLHRTQTVVNGLEDGESDCESTPSLALFNYLSTVFVAIATRVRPMASVLSSVEDTPASSHLHNVRRAINTVDRIRYVSIIN